jgi:coenzyme F420-dependent glucose-6-phosphate dehydrogenase
MVTFGISPECLCHDVRDNVRRVHDLEEAGFTHIWEGDHTLPWQHSSGHSAGIWASLGAFLANTEKAIVGPMVMPPIGIRHQPVDVAVEIATLALLYPGRVALGVGTGEAMNEKTTTGFWPSHRERIERLVEGIELIRQCWEEPDYFEHKGKYFNSFFYLYQKPEQRIPIICAAGGPKMATNAGRLADGYIAVGVPAETHTNVLMPAFDSGAESVGRMPPQGYRTAWVSTSYHPDRSRAYEGARVYGGLLIPEAYLYIQDPRVIEQRALLVRDEALEQAFCIATSGEEIIARFEAYIEAGCDHIVWADMSPDPTLVAPVCRNEVLPYLKRKYGSAVVEQAPVAASASVEGAGR